MNLAIAVKSTFKRTVEFWHRVRWRNEMGIRSARRKMGSIARSLQQSNEDKTITAQELERKTNLVIRYSQNASKKHKNLIRADRSLLILQIFGGNKWHLTDENPIEEKTDATLDADHDPLL